MMTKHLNSLCHSKP